MGRIRALRVWAVSLLLVLALTYQSRAQFGDLQNEAFELLKAGRYADAIPYAEQAVEAADTGKARAHALVLLANLRSILGQFDLSEPLYKKAIALQEAALGADDPDLANSLENLGHLYFVAGRYDEAARIFQRAFAIAEKAYPDSQYMITSHLKNLADVYRVRGKFKEAEPLLERSVAIWQEQYGDESALLAEPLADLAYLHYLEGRYAEAELLLSRAIGLHEAQFDPRHTNFARMIFALGRVQQAQGQLQQAEASINRALSIWREALNATHPAVVEALTGLASVYLAQSQPALALRQLREATGILVRRGLRLSAAQRGSNSVGEISDAEIFRLYVVALDRVGAGDKSGEESFAAAQRGRQTETALAISQMGERRLGGSGSLGTLVRERQDINRRWRAADQGLSSALGNGNSDAADAARSEMTSLERQLGEIQRKISQQFPQFTSFAGSVPLSIKEVQALLKADEVLIQFLETPEIGQNKPEMYAWLIGKSEFRWEKLAIAPKALEIAVGTLRCGLDAQTWDDPEGRERCASLLGGMPPSLQPLPFDLKTASTLFGALFGHFAPQIAGKKLIVIPSEGMASLPLGVLVADSGGGAPAGYAGAKWLAETNAISILPSVSNLQALRKLVKDSSAGLPFVGFGDPVLRGNPSCRQAAIPPACPSAKPTQEVNVAAQGRGTLSRMPLPKLYRQGLADIEALQNQCPLPETAFELGCVARSLGAPLDSLHLKDQATEKAVKSIALQNYRVLHFATHGLLAIESQLLTGGSVAEPALLLTPPARATEVDDGLLTASEILQLKMDADWVLLSACNTAGGATAASGEALSGLARSFFYAGARAILVTHWAVNSRAAIQLTTQAFAELKQRPEIGRAEAHRRSMLRLMKGQVKEENHPAYWAAFSLIGVP